MNIEFLIIYIIIRDDMNNLPLLSFNYVIILFIRVTLSMSSIYNSYFIVLTNSSKSENFNFSFKVSPTFFLPPRFYKRY